MSLGGVEVNGAEAVVAELEDGIEIRPGERRLRGLQQQEADGAVRDGTLRHRQMLAIHEQQRSAAGLQQFGHLLAGKGGVERHRDRAGGNGAEVRGHPARAVGGKNGAAGSALD